MAARSYEGKRDGLYVAAKGGHNDESHNHNDVGNFIVYCDGYPAIIDVGVETYTTKTFSGNRYEIWTMQSAFHNLPTVNGIMQKDGRSFKANDVVYNAGKRRVVFGLDISKAYPEEAKLISWKRTITLDRGKRVDIHDDYVLTEVKEDLQLTFMSWRRPEMETEGRVRLENPEEIRHLKTVFVLYDREKFKIDVETIPLEDARLQASWGDMLYRMVFTARQTALKDEFRFVIEQE